MGKTDLKKKIIKEKIVNAIVAKAGARIVVFEPPDKEADLAVKKRAQYAGKEILLQIQDLEGLGNNLFAKEIAQKGFEPAENLYLVFAYFDPISQELIDDVWLVPSLEFKELAKLQTPKEGLANLRFQASANPEKQDEHARFLIAKKDLARLLIEIVGAK